jgi:hypothetical protein
MPTQEEQLVMAGDEAEAVLSAPAFTSVVDSIVESAFSTFVNTQPEEATKRETAYHHYRAIADVVNTLKQRVEVRNSIVAQGDNSQEELGL